MIARTRTATLFVLASFAALGAAASTASAAGQVATPITGLFGMQLNDQQQVFGYTNTSYGEGYQPPALWEKGVLTALPGPVSSFNISVNSSLSEGGEVIGDAYDFGDLKSPKPLNVVRTSTKGFTVTPWTDGEFTFLASGALLSYDFSTRVVSRDGVPVWTAPDGVNGVSFGRDGSLVANFGDSKATDVWYPAVGGTAVPLPGATDYGYVVGAGGHVAAMRIDGDNGSIVHWKVDKETGTVTQASYPAPNRNFAGLAVNGKGTVVWGTHATNDFQSALTVQRAKAGMPVEDITAALGANAGGANIVTDVNEWGDALFAGYTGTIETGFKNTTVLLAAPRSALTGQVQPTGTAGGRGRAGLAGKVVTLNGGVSPITATTDAKGKFRIDVPAGSGYVLVAPAGTCLIAANGCHTSTPLAPVGETGAPIALAKVSVPALGSFVNKVGAKLVPVRGKVTLTVRCRATVACKATVTLRRGRSVYGTGAATVAAGKTKAVVVTLNRAATTALAGTATIPVGATLVTKAGATSASTALSVKLVRPMR